MARPVRVPAHNVHMDLGDVARQLRATEPRINRILTDHLRGAYPPVSKSIRASVYAIPVKGTSGSTGLRARIAGAVDGWAKETPEGAQVGVGVFPGLTFGGDAYYTLPGYMEGADAGAKYARWRHPVFGRSDEPWSQQDHHPYFFGPASFLLVTAGIALNGALDEISRLLS